MERELFQRFFKNCYLILIKNKGGIKNIMGNHEINLRLEPLNQWICDECGEIIKSPEDGWLEWIAEEGTGLFCGHRIAHHAAASPYRKDNNKNCYRYSQNPRKADMHLGDFTGHEGIGKFFSVLNLKQFSADIENWLEVFRRLHLKYYEEARLYWEDAHQDGFFEDKKSGIYLPHTLLELITQYGNLAS